MKHPNESYVLGDDSGQECYYENKEVLIDSPDHNRTVTGLKCGCIWRLSNLEYLEYLYDKKVLNGK